MEQTLITQQEGNGNQDENSIPREENTILINNAHKQPQTDDDLGNPDKIRMMKVKSTFYQELTYGDRTVMNIIAPVHQLKRSNSFDWVDQEPSFYLLAKRHIVMERHRITQKMIDEQMKKTQLVLDGIHYYKTEAGKADACLRQEIERYMILENFNSREVTALMTQYEEEYKENPAKFQTKNSDKYEPPKSAIDEEDEKADLSSESSDEDIKERLNSNFSRAGTLNLGEIKKKSTFMRKGHGMGGGALNRAKFLQDMPTKSPSMNTKSSLKTDISNVEIDQSDINVRPQTDLKADNQESDIQPRVSVNVPQARPKIVVKAPSIDVKVAINLNKETKKDLNQEQRSNLMTAFGRTKTITEQKMAPIQEIKIKQATSMIGDLIDVELDQTEHQKLIERQSAAKEKKHVEQTKIQVRNHDRVVPVYHSRQRSGARDSIFQQLYSGSQGQKPRPTTPPEKRETKRKIEQRVANYSYLDKLTKKKEHPPNCKCTVCRVGGVKTHYQPLDSWYENAKNKRIQEQKRKNLQMRKTVTKPKQVVISNETIKNNSQ